MRNDRSTPFGLVFKRMLPDAQTPRYATDGSGAFDVCAAGLGTHTHTVQPGGAVTFNTGLAFEIPEGWAMLVLSRSGDGFKRDVRLANCVGLIDSDYRGTLGVRLTADPHGTGIGVRNGDRIAQCMLVRAPRWRFIEHHGDLSDTARGAGGYGSTGR